MPSAAAAAAAAAMPALPPGFRFHPTDEELIVHYLTRQAAFMACPVPIIAEVNIYKCNPWDLPAQALFGENEWYFFSPRDRKYPNGARPNRAAGSGYWKATGTDKAILSTPASENIGVKKALVFYEGKPPKGSKTDWIMHEYRLTAGNRCTKRRGSSMRLDDWVLCRIHKKCSNNLQQFSSSDHEQDQEGSTVEDSHNNVMNNNNGNYNAVSSPKSEAFAGGDNEQQLQQLRPMAIAKSCSLTDLLNTVDYAALSQLVLDGGGGGAAPADQPPPESPLIYAPPPWQTLNYNNSYHHIDVPQLSEARVDDHYYANDNNYNNGMKRKRCFEDGGGGDIAKKLPQLLPSDSRTGSSSYWNQVQIADQTSFQYSGMMIHPFLNQQQLLLNNNSSHLQM